MVVPVIPPEIALMTVGPMFMVAVASPCEPSMLLIVAIPGSEEFQVTDAVTLRLVLSANVPVAVNWTVVPGAMLELTGANDRDTKGAGVGGVTSEVLQPTNRNRTAYIAMIHNRGLFCMVLVLILCNVTDCIPSEDLVYIVSHFLQEDNDEFHGHTCHIMASKSSVGTFN